MHSYLLASKLTAWSQKSFSCLSLSVALCTSNSEKSHRVFFSHIEKTVRRHFPHDWCWITAALCQGKVQMYHCVAGTDPKPISICPSRESVEHRGSAQPLLGGEVRKKWLQHHWNSWGNWAWRWFVEHNEFDKYCLSFFIFFFFLYCLWTNGQFLLYDICNFYFPEGSRGVGAVRARAVPVTQGPALCPWHNLGCLFYHSSKGFYLVLDWPKARWR